MKLLPRQISLDSNNPAVLPGRRAIVESLLRRSLVLLSVVWGLLVVMPGVVGCASHFDGHVYRRGDLAFRLDGVPSSWHRLDTNGALLAFRDERARATIMVNGRCGKDGDDVPLEALTRHLFLYFTERKVLQRHKTMMDGREALVTVEVAKLDGVPRRFVSVVLKKDGCVYDFIHITGPTAVVRSEREFERFVAGFHTIAP